jgi:hypothetical protein
VAILAALALLAAGVIPGSGALGEVCPYTTR